MNDEYTPVTHSETFKIDMLEKLSLRLGLRDIAKNIVSDTPELKRLSECGNISSNAVPVLFVPYDNSVNPYFLANFCESAYCPHCACKVGAVRLGNLEKGIVSFKNMFVTGMIVMMVLTFSHCATDELHDIGRKFSKSKESFFRQLGVRQALSSLGRIGRVTAPETTYGFNSGFHPHEHILFFFEKSVSDDKLNEFQKLLGIYWVGACKKFGLFATPERLYFKRAVSDYLTEYITKCAREITLQDCKTGRASDRFAPFQLLYKYDETRESIYAEKFKEYALFNKGRHSHQWSRGLAKTLSVKDCLPENESESKNLKEGINIIFNPESFKNMGAYNMALAQCAAHGENSSDKLKNFLKHTSDSFISDSVSEIEIQGKRFSGDSLYSSYKLNREGGVYEP